MMWTDVNHEDLNTRFNDDDCDDDDDDDDDDLQQYKQHYVWDDMRNPLSNTVKWGFLGIS